MALQTFPAPIVISRHVRSTIKRLHKFINLGPASPLVQAEEVEQRPQEALQSAEEVRDVLAANAGGIVVVASNNLQEALCASHQQPAVLGCCRANDPRYAQRKPSDFQTSSWRVLRRDFREAFPEFHEHQEGTFGSASCDCAIRSTSWRYPRES